MTDSDRETFLKAQPYLRSILAFLLFLRYENVEIDPAYQMANQFIDRCYKDASVQEDT